LGPAWQVGDTLFEKELYEQAHGRAFPLVAERQVFGAPFRGAVPKERNADSPKRLPQFSSCAEGTTMKGPKEERTAAAASEALGAFQRAKDELMVQTCEALGTQGGNDALTMIQVTESVATRHISGAPDN
jgi:hypothetical protein